MYVDTRLVGTVVYVEDTYVYYFTRLFEQGSEVTVRAGEGRQLEIVEVEILGTNLCLTS